MAKVPWMVGALSGGGLMGEEEVERFPAGLRVLVVDDDITCLTVLRQMLLQCHYEVTTCSQATKALALLRESKGGFHVVISDVHMPDMDGFRLLELVGLEMDLPVIMMSADARTNVVMQGIKHGACDYLIKPVRMEELKNIWQHVFRKKWRENDLELSGSLDDTDRSKHVIDDAEHASSLNDGSDAMLKSHRRKRNAKDEDDNEPESDHPAKKPRVVWSVELHQQFVNAVNQLGIEQAVPKRILELMNVPGLTRENVASHLQKFRLYLKRLSGVSPQHSGFPSPFCAPVSGARVSGPLEGLDFRALAASGRIPQETLSALQDELLDQPSGSLFLPSLNQHSLQASNQVTKQAPPMLREIAFGQPLFISRQSPQSSRAMPDVPFAFSSWTGNDDLSVASSSGKFGGLGGPGTSNVLSQMLQQQQKLDSPMAGSPTSNVKPSCVVIPSRLLHTIQDGKNLMLNQESSSVQVAKFPSSKNQDTNIAPSKSPSGLNTPSNSVPVVRNTTLLSESSKLQGGVVTNNESKPAPSQLLANIKTERYPLHVNQHSTLVTHEVSSSHEGSGRIVRRDNLNSNNNISTLDYNLLSAQSRDVRFGFGQIVDDGFRNSSVSTGCSVPGFIASPASSCTDGNTAWQGQSAGRNNSKNTASVSPSLPNSSEIQDSLPVFGNLANSKRGRSLGFVGKGTCIPSRFAVDDVESPTGSLDQINIYNSDGGGMMNQENFRFNGLH